MRGIILYMSASQEFLHTTEGLMAHAKKITLGEGQKTSLREIVATIPYGTLLKDNPPIWYPNQYKVPTRTDVPDGWNLAYERPIVSPNTYFGIYSGNEGKDVSQRSYYGNRPVVLAHMAIYEMPNKTGKVRFRDPWGETVETDLSTKELLQAQHIPNPEVLKETLGVTDARNALFDFLHDHMPTIDAAITHITTNKPLSSLPLVLAGA